MFCCGCIGVLNAFCGWRGWEYCVVVGLRASKRDKSGVIVLEVGCCGLIGTVIELLDMAVVAELGVDQAKDGVVDVFDTFLGDCTCAGAESHPPSRGLDGDVGPAFPLTRRSKSISGSSEAPLLLNAFVAPKDMKSSLALAWVPFAPDSS